MFNNPFKRFHMYLKHSWTLLFCSILHSAFYGNISTVMTNNKIKISCTNQAVNALLSSIHVKKVTDWTSTVSAACRLLTASVWYIGRVSIGQEEWGKKRENKFLPTHGKAELWSAANTCCSVGACFTYGPSDQRASFSLLSLTCFG